MHQNFKIKLAAIAKDEGFYLPLWVYHHLCFGFDVLDIRINDTTDNSLQILEKLKAIYGDRLRFSLADQEMEFCRAKNINFQAYMYKKIHTETLKEDFTHLLFLDLDEYWCSLNFSETIKDCLKSLTDFDVCMFQWLLDQPSTQRSFVSFSFQPMIIGQKNKHVKSLINMKASLVAMRIHNAVIKRGNYVLADQTLIQFADDDQVRATLPDSIFENQCLKLENYFIYHQMYRSQEEYLAGLLRGNKQNGDDSLLKTNRNGYLASQPEDFNLVWQIDESVLNAYKQGYLELRAVLKPDLDEAKRFILARKDKVLELLSNDAFMRQIHANKMSGISEHIYQAQANQSTIRAKIAELSFDECQLVCSFKCEIISKTDTYQLQITQGFSQTLVKANIKLISEQCVDSLLIKNFEVNIKLEEFNYLVYKNQPPFCLVAHLNDELVVLERLKFRSVAASLLSHFNQFKNKTIH
jgi:hypothetical protein